MVGDRGGLFLDSYGLTCGGLELNMTGVYSPGSAECADLQGKYRKSCCDATYTPIPVEQPPTPPPGSSYPQGNEPICDICLDGSFPTKPFSVTAVLYISDNPKCEDLFWMGRAGTIPGRLCYPLQDYMQVPCGCKPTNPTVLPPDLTRRGPTGDGKLDKDSMRLPAGGRTRGGTLRRLKGET